MTDETTDTPLDQDAVNMRDTPIDGEPVLDTDNTPIEPDSANSPEDLTPPPDAPPRLGTEPSTPDSGRLDRPVIELVEEFAHAVDDADLNEADSFEDIIEMIVASCDDELETAELEALREELDED